MFITAAVNLLHIIIQSIQNRNSAEINYKQKSV